MSRHYLFGPVTGRFAEQNLHSLCQAGECVAFFSDGSEGLTIGPGESWEDVLSRLPAEWRPDFVVVDLHYTSIPACLWQAPVPLVDLAQDWNLLWHNYRRLLTGVDLVLTDRGGVERLGRAGILHARAANLFGLERGWIEDVERIAIPSNAWDGKADGLAIRPTAEGDAPQLHSPRGLRTTDHGLRTSDRDIDILFVGNLHPAVQRERMPWLARLGQMSGRRRVHILQGVFEEEYRRLAERARIVFNRSIRGECNMRAFEAAAAGALLFQEAENLEVADYFRDRLECVFYTDENLESLLDYYLDHEEERQAIAEAGRERVRAYTFANLWAKHLELIEREWPGIEERMRRRCASQAGLDWEARVWQACCNSSKLTDATLVADLETALVAAPERAELHQGLGFALTAVEWGENPWELVEHFRCAAERAPNDRLAGLNLVEALTVCGQRQPAIAEARRVLRCEVSRRGAEDAERANTSSASSAPLRETIWDMPRYPLTYDFFRVEWERTAWSHAGEPAAEVRAKEALLSWRLHHLLAELTGELAHFEEAVELRPDLPNTQAALGCALARIGRVADAVPHLREAVKGNPFDLHAARALYQALLDSGDTAGRHEFARQRALLARTAPRAVPVEPWFSETAGEPPPVPLVVNPPNALRLQTVGAEDFERQFGRLDTSRAVHSFTIPRDAHIVLTLLASTSRRRILEIGTAAGHMTANLTEWSLDDAVVFSLGVVEDLAIPTMATQRCEDPPRAMFGRHANHFGKAGKVFFITADSLRYDFSRLGPLDFVFIDGAHDLEHVLSDSRKAYAQLTPGGCLVWHDFDSPTPWVAVRQALERLGFEEIVQHVAGTEVAFLQKGKMDCQTVPPQRTACQAVLPASCRLCIAWEGDQLAVHSLAHVNRAIASELLNRGHELSLLATDRPGDPTATLAGDPRLLACFQQPLTGAVDIHVRHQWPPRFTPPPARPWVIFQHWEFGSLPRSWIEPMSRQVDEIWVASRWVRSCFIDSGIPAEQVHVIPLGVDPARYQPQAPALGLRTSKRFRFLFVGGTIQRKGIDVLLEAYGQAFKKSDDVCLVIKDMGVGTFYRDQTAEERIASFRSRPEAPEIEYINQSFTEMEMAGLYTACNCLVHPFRGEGFGLPIVEAMACGLPVIVTGYGPVLDYCQGSTAYFVPARLMRLPQKRIGDEATVDFPWLAEPDQELLQAWMRFVVAHPDQARALGAAASQHVHGQFTWEHTAAAVEQRVQALKRRLPRRERATIDHLPSRLTQEPDAQARDPASGGCEPPGFAVNQGIHISGTAPNRGIYTSGTALDRGVHTPRSPGPSPAHLACVCDLFYIGAPRCRRFSANLIVKNEESNLPGCLESLAGLFDEIIVVDTGSNDQTREIALDHGAKVFDFPWVDSFAAARNECLRHSTGDWIFWMDADDRLDDANRQELLDLFAGLDGDHAAFAMQCLCAPAADTGVATAVQHVRLFRNHPQLRWEQRIHEQILPAVRRLGDALRFTDIQVQHTGYLDPALRCRKRERDLRLLLLEYAEQPQHPFTLFNLGMTYVDFQIPEVALPLLQRSLARSATADSIVRKLHYLIVQCHRQLRQPAAALAACERGRADYPNDAELLSQEAQLRGEQGDFSGAETCYLQLLTTEEGPHLASVPLGLKGFRTRHNLGVLYRQHDRHAEAETQWRLAVAEQPDFLPSRLALEELSNIRASYSVLEQ